jgi:hypothetical protein
MIKVGFIRINTIKNKGKINKRDLVGFVKYGFRCGKTIVNNVKKKVMRMAAIYTYQSHQNNGICGGA